MLFIDGMLCPTLNSLNVIRCRGDSRIARFVLRFIVGEPNVYERAHRLPPGGRDALRKYAYGIFLAKAGSKLCLRPGQKAVTEGD